MQITESQRRDRGEYEGKYDDFDLDAKSLIEKSMQIGKEFYFIEFLMQSPFYRCEKKIDKLCRDFLTLIKNKYKNVLMENLL